LKNIDVSYPTVTKLVNLTVRRCLGFARPNLLVMGLNRFGRPNRFG